MQCCYERPMMLNTWTQTSNADLGISDDYMQNMEELRQRERVLIEKIHDLESKLRIQSEMLSQKSASGRRRSTHLKGAHSPRQQLQEVIVNQIPVQVHENHPPNMQRQQQEQYTGTQFKMYNTQVSPMNVHRENMSQAQISPHHRLEPNTSDQNSMQAQNMTQNVNVAFQHQDVHSVTNTIQGGRPRKVNYTIIADGSVNGHDGPIEIEIAEEENAEEENVSNGSADSERLEICLAEEQPQSAANVNYIKLENSAEQNKENSIPVAPVAKRIKMSAENLLQNSNQNNCEIAKSARTVSDNSNIRTTTESSQAVSRLSVVADDNHYNLPVLQQQQQQQRQPAIVGEITNDVREERPTAYPELKSNSFTSIGPNNTCVPNKIFDSINWENPSLATRKLMIALFDRFTLATHSMTGKPSPAFKDHNKPLKKMLNPMIVQDIIFAVTRRSKVNEKEVRAVITTKCADENKMWKLAQAKGKNSDQNKENLT